MIISCDFNNKNYNISIPRKDYDYLYDIQIKWFWDKLDEILDNKILSRSKKIDLIHNNFTKVQFMTYGYCDCLQNQNIITQFDEIILSSTIIEEFSEQYTKRLNDLS